MGILFDAFRFRIFDHQRISGNSHCINFIAAVDLSYVIVNNNIHTKILAYYNDRLLRLVQLCIDFYCCLKYPQITLSGSDIKDLKILESKAQVDSQVGQALKKNLTPMFSSKTRSLRKNHTLDKVCSI